MSWLRVANMSDTLSYSTKSNRLKNGVSLDLPNNFRSIWVSRLDNIKSMLKIGLTTKEISKHYQCKNSCLLGALSYHNQSVKKIRGDL